MSQYIINNNGPLSGEIRIGGAKNSALPIIVALAGALIAVGAVAVSLLVAAGATVVYIFLSDMNMMTRAFFIGGIFLSTGAAILLIELIRFVAVAIGREVSIRLRRRNQ